MEAISKVLSSCFWKGADNAFRYNAICTPGFFGFSSTCELQYRGRLDDARMNNATDRSIEFFEAMRLVANAGNAPKQQQASMACSIKWR